MNPLPAIRRSCERSLGVKALVAVVVAVGLTMAASTHYHFYAAGKEAEAKLQQRAALVAMLLSDALARPLFDFNHPAVISAVNAIGVSSEIGAIRVRDAAGDAVAAVGESLPDGPEGFSIQQKIVYADGTNNHPVGTLELRILRHEMQRQLREVLLQGIATNILLGVVIILFLMALARRTRRDFGTVVQALEALRAGDTTPQLGGIRRQDEVGRLAQVVESFREALNERREALAARQKLQDELQQERERAAQEALDRTQEQYRLVVENVSEGIVVVQGDRVVLANPHVEKLVGMDQAELRSRPFIDFVHPDDRELVIDRHRRRMAGEEILPRYSFRILARDGKPIWVELSAVVFEWQGAPATLSFITDITQRRQAEEDIRQALEKQRELNDLKSRFVSMTSHEFRTPLATILSSVELIKYYSDRLPPEEKAQLITSIEGAIRRMTKMLDDILVIGKADAGRLEFRPQPVDVENVFRVLADEAARAFPSSPEAVRRIDYRFDCDGSRRLLDEALLRHVLGNLVSNAFKYSPADSHVELSVVTEGECVRFIVRDHGIGIPEEDLPRLFETFHRATNVGNISGTGLGMTIVQRALQLHGGEIEVRSTIGEGTEFIVTLPAAACREDEAATLSGTSEVA